MAQLEINLLGFPEIKLDGERVKTDRRKAVALLAYLAVTGKPHTRDHLAGFLWPDYAQDSAFAYLRRTLWELNNILGKGWIEADREHISLNNKHELSTDSRDFEEILEREENKPSKLQQAIDLYKGDFLQGFTVHDAQPFEEWQFRQAEHLRRLYAKGLEQLVERFSLNSDYETALPYAQEWVSLDTLNEAAQRALMRVYASMGDRTSAVRQYESCCEKLKEALGIGPQPETEALYQSILRGEVVDKAPVDPISPSRAENAPPIRLPVMPTPFIGRRPEVEEIKTLLTSSEQRLVTLIGPGGSGKTRLAIQAASELEDYFADGIFFILLAPVQNPDAVIGEIAKTFEFAIFQQENRPRQMLLEFLQEKQLLLVIDNFEHLIEASTVVTDLITNLTDVKVLVTSRVRLNIQGEQLYQVTGMRTPAEIESNSWKNPEEQAKPFSAVQLFLDRARRITPGFILNPENSQAVLEICRLVAGMPLAIELAAGWLALLSPEEIADEIAESTDFLSTQLADVPERQRSLRAVFDSSWKMLTEEERKVFQLLCVFVGSFSREAAQHVGGASLETLLGLVNKSFLQHDNGRFQLHELMRQYGIEKLKSDPTDWEEAKDRHSAFFTGFVQEQAKRLQSAEQPQALKLLDQEIGSNILAAVEWLVEREQWEELTGPTLIGLFHYVWIRDQMASLLPWLRKARLKLSHPKMETEKLAYAILGTLEVLAEDVELIMETNPLERLAEIWDFTNQQNLEDKIGFWLVVMSGLAQNRHIDPKLEGKLDLAVDNLRNLDDPWLLGVALLFQATPSQYYFLQDKILEAKSIFEALDVPYEQGNVAEVMGRHAVQQKQPVDEAIKHFQRAESFFKLLPRFQRSWITFIHITGMYFREGQFEEGFSLHHKTQKILEAEDNQRLLAHSLHWEALHASRFSTPEHALEVRLRSRALFQQMENQTAMAWQTYELAEIYRISGDRMKAVEMYTQVQTKFEKWNHLLGQSHLHRALGDLAMADGDYQTAKIHYQQFKSYSEQDNHEWSIGQSHGKLAWALAYLGEIDNARKELKTGLRKLVAWGEDDLLLVALLAEPVCLIQEGKPEKAVELAAFIQHYPISWYETRMLAERILEKANSQLDEKAAAAAVERGKALILEEVVAGLIAEEGDGPVTEAA